MKKYTLILVLSFFALAGCSGDEAVFGAGNNTIQTNSGVVSQKNMVVTSDDLTLDYHDLVSATPGLPNTGNFTAVSATITINIGDRNNKILTDSHTVFFRAQWGLIESSCVTDNGTCSVNWQSVAGIAGVPLVNSRHRTQIVAYTVGEETFIDINDNGTFDDGDTFTSVMDTEEPFIDTNGDNTHVNGIDQTIDVLLPLNGVHDTPDGFFNGAGCTHSSLCSTNSSVFVWDTVTLNLDGGVAHP